MRHKQSVRLGTPTVSQRVLLHSLALQPTSDLLKADGPASPQSRAPDDHPCLWLLRVLAWRQKDGLTEWPAALPLPEHCSEPPPLRVYLLRTWTCSLSPSGGVPGVSLMFPLLFLQLCFLLSAVRCCTTGHPKLQCLNTKNELLSYDPVG